VPGVPHHPTPLPGQWPRQPQPPGHRPATPPPALPPRGPRRTALATLCLVLGLGLLAGAGAGIWISGSSASPAATARERSAQSFSAARGVWHSVPVDTLFPRTLTDRAAGPGGADRTWIRIGVSPDAGCARAFDPLLAKVLAPVGCERLLRATYTDATSSHVTTVGVLVTTTDAAGMRTLRDRWKNQHLGERTGLIPRTAAFPGTDSASFGVRQRGCWTVFVSADLPLIVYAVSGFADGREISVPQPAELATAEGVTTAPAQSGLGFDAEGLSKAVVSRAGKAAAAIGSAATEAP
jgi:hypothetical protein